MFNSVGSWFPNAPSIKSFTPDLGSAAHKVAEIVKDGTVFFVVTVGLGVGAGLALLFQVDGAVDDQLLLVLMGAVASLILGFILKAANERPQTKTAQSTENTLVNDSTLAKPKGLINGWNTCFISALFQTFINDPKLCANIVEIGKYTLTQQQDEDPWKFVLETIQNYATFEEPLTVMRAFSIDERAKRQGVMGDPQELMLGMLRNIPTSHPREGEKPFFAKEEIQGFKSLYFEEVRVVEWKKSADQLGLEVDNQKTEQQKYDNFSVMNRFSRETIPSWCFSVDMEKPQIEGETKTSLALSEVIAKYFQIREIKGKTIKKALDNNGNVARYETISERVELGAVKPSKFFLHIKRFVTKEQPAPAKIDFPSFADFSFTKSSLFSGSRGASPVPTLKQTEEGTKSSVEKKEIKIEKVTTPIPIENTFLKQLAENTQAPYRITLEQSAWKASYVLQSVILHANWGGTSTEHGHYTTLARNDGIWWVFNDTIITQASKDDVKKYLSEGYLYQFNLEEPVQEAGKVVIGNVNEQPNHQNDEGDDQLLHRSSPNGLLSNCFNTSKENVTSV